MTAGMAFWQTGSSGGGGGALDLLHVRDEKAAGTQGGGSTAGAWNARVLNTVKTNDIAGASLASNTITLPAGTYEARITVPSFRSNATKSRLRDTTAGATVLVGTSGHSNNSSGANILNVVAGRFTLASSGTLQVQQWHETTIATFGLGHQGPGSGAHGEVEVYTDVLIWQVA